MSDIICVDPERNFNLKYCLPQRNKHLASNNVARSNELSTSFAQDQHAQLKAISDNNSQFSTSAKSHYNDANLSEKQLFSPPYVPDMTSVDKSTKLKKYSILLALASLLLILSSFPVLFSHNHYKDCIANKSLSLVQTYKSAQTDSHSEEDSAFSLISMKISHFFNNYSAFNDGFDLWKSSTEYVNLKPREDLTNSSTIATTTSNLGGSSNDATSVISPSTSITTTSAATRSPSTSLSETSISVSTSSSSSITFSSSSASQSSSSTGSLISSNPSSTSFSNIFTSSSSSEVSTTLAISDTSSSFFSSNVASTTTSDSVLSNQNSQSSITTSSPTLTSASVTSPALGSVVVLGITSTETFSKALSTLTVSSTATTAKPTLTSESSTSYSKGLSPKNKKIVIGCVVGIVGGFLFMALVAFAWYKFYYLRNHPKYVNSEGFWVDKNVETNNAVVLDNSSYDNVNLDNGQVGDRYNS